MRSLERHLDMRRPRFGLAVAVVLLFVAPNCEPEATPGLLARVSPESVSPMPVTISKRLQGAWQIVDAELPHADALVALRLGQIRRHARLVSAPATLVARLPAQTHDAEVFLAPPLLDEVGVGCEVAAAVTLLGTGIVKRVSLPAIRAEQAQWQRVALTTSATPAPTELRIALAAGPACKSAAPMTAVSEVVARGASPTAVRSNVLLVVIDTLRRDVMDCGERSRELTPNLYERGCKRGVFFSDAVSTAPWTYPAVASMLTGLRPRDHHGEGMDREQHDIERSLPTLAEILRWSGYEAHAVVANWQAGRGLWRGFDSFAEMHPYLGRGFAEERRADHVVDTTIALLRDGIREPFFLWVLFIDLHEPVDAAIVDSKAPAECAGIAPVPTRWEGLSRLTPPLTPDAEHRLACRQALYRASLAFIDRHLGRLFDELDRRGIAGRTSIVVASDHGEEMWEHGAEQFAAGEKSRDTWGVGHGHTLYQELLRVPLLVVPAVITGKGRAVATEASLVAVSDVFATVLGLAGVQASSASSSRDLLRSVPPPSPWSSARASHTARNG